MGLRNNFIFLPESSIRIGKGTIAVEIYKNVPLNGDFQGYYLTRTMFRYICATCKGFPTRNEYGI
jgi:hypothetical protein